MSEFGDKVRLVRESPLVESTLEACGVERRGKKWLCPFHDEHDASLAVHGDGTWWRCYGCNRTGTAIDLVMHHYGVEFRQAVEMLYAGMSHPGWTEEVLLRMSARDRRDEDRHERDVCRMLWDVVVLGGSQLRKSETPEMLAEIERVLASADYHLDRAQDEPCCPPAAYLGLVWDSDRLALIARFRAS